MVIGGFPNRVYLYPQPGSLFKKLGQNYLSGPTCVEPSLYPQKHESAQRVFNNRTRKILCVYCSGAPRHKFLYYRAIQLIEEMRDG